MDEHGIDGCPPLQRCGQKGASIFYEAARYFELLLNAARA
jgi:hypothetical protein